MDKKIRLGLNLFFSNSGNSGIVNYIYNIISALKTLPENQSPAILVFYTADAPINYIKEIYYPNLEFILFKPYSSYKLINGVNRILNTIFKKNFYLQFKYFNKIDVLYPYFEFNDSAFAHIAHKIHWVVDFNNRAFPSHYPDNGKVMENFQKNLTKRKDHIVLSSQSLFDELKFYYPYFKNKVSILPFACSLPDISGINIQELKNKYGLYKPYLMSPNQFWEHKNQLVLIEALHILKLNEDLNLQVVFTGSMDVNRGKGHMLQKLLDVIEKYQLKENIMFLGVIDRHEQLALMKHAKALVQPSLYEGWSTLVEEAKVLNQKIILSDLPVHREQKCVNSYFFNPLSAEDLAKQIMLICETSNPSIAIDYTKNVKAFGQGLLKILTDEVG